MGEWAILVQGLITIWEIAKEKVWHSNIPIRIHIMKYWKLEIRGEVIDNAHSNT